MGLLSFDSTMKSNLGVARPIDVAVIPRERSREVIGHRIGENDAYFEEITRRWARALQLAARDIPNPEWLSRGTGRRSRRPRAPAKNGARMRSET